MVTLSSWIQFSCQLFSYLIECDIVIASSIVTLAFLFCSHLSYSDEIVPSESSFSIKPTCVELRLKKASRVRWKALERPQHSPGITVTNSNSNSSQLTIKNSQQLTNQNADDSVLNDSSVDTNSSHVTTSEPHNDVTMTSQRKEPYTPQQSKVALMPLPLPPPP